MIKSATSRAFDTIDKWPASSSIVFAFIRWAMNRSRSGLIVRSFFDTAAHPRSFQVARLRVPYALNARNPWNDRLEAVAEDSRDVAHERGLEAR
jgi:hypothetical protein